MTHRTASALVLAAAALTAACSQSPVPIEAPTPTAVASAAAHQVKSPSAAAATHPASSPLLKWGSNVAIPATPTHIMCKDPDGGVQVVPLIRCNDGSHLGSVEQRTGASRGWFLAGDLFHPTKGDVAADAGYAAAYRKCNA